MIDDGLPPSTDPLAREIADLVADLGRRGGLEPVQAYRLRLAADEITTNVVQHGYRGRPGPVEIDGGVEPDWVWLRIRDTAPPFDPRTHDPTEHLAADPAHRPAGGCGLHLARTGVDRFDYDYVDGNRTTLRIRRRPDSSGRGKEVTRDGQDPGLGDQ